MNKLSVSEIHYEYNICFSNSLSFSRSPHEFAMNYVWDYYEITISSLFFPDFTENSSFFFAYSPSFTILFAESRWIYYPFTLSLWIHYRFCDFTPNQVSIVISLKIHHIFWEFTLSSLSVSRNSYEFTIGFAI